MKRQLVRMSGRCLRTVSQIALAVLTLVLSGMVLPIQAQNPPRSGQTPSTSSTSITPPSTFSTNQPGAINLGTFTFSNDQFGNTLSESDGGVFRNGNWLNIVNSNPGTPGALTGPNFNTGIANIGFNGSSPVYTIRYNTPIVNGSNADLGIVSARFSTNDTFRLAVSTDGTNFTAFVNFGPELAVSTGVGVSYFYAPSGGPFPSTLVVTPVDLSAFGLASGASVSAIMITSSPEGDLIRVAGFERPCESTVDAVTIRTNEDCDSNINPNCQPNIVRADGVESTDVNVKVDPAQAVSVHLTTSFGTIADVDTDSAGKATGTYLSGVITAGNTSTTIANLNATICDQTFQDLSRIFNYNGFNFHESQVSNDEFIDFTAMDTDAIQSFFEARGSFLARFMLVGRIGGFLDTNGNGRLDTGEPVYSAMGQAVPMNAHGISAATIFSRAATGQEVNPKVLIVTVEKENSLISRTTLPNQTVLNFAMGCGNPSDFVEQIQCSAKTLARRFKDTRVFGRTISYPFFFHATDGVRHSVTGLGRQPVGFAVNTAATYAQYRYTPFIQSLQNGGGVFLFERIWLNFGF